MLEIKIGGGNFLEILAAGGSFVSGGYNCTLVQNSGNFYGGSQAWGGDSGGWTTTVINLPSAAAGQNVQLRWVLSTDSSNLYPAVGWYVDSLSLQDGTYACCTAGTNVPPAITTQPTGQVAVAGANVTFTVGANGTAPLTYRWYFNNTTPIGTNGPVLGLSNVQPSQAGPYKVVVTNSAGSVTGSIASLTVLVPPSITLQPSNKTTIAGSNISFDGAASGSLPLTYQWGLWRVAGRHQRPYSRSLERSTNTYRTLQIGRDEFWRLRHEFYSNAHGAHSSNSFVPAHHHHRHVSLHTAGPTQARIT